MTHLAPAVSMDLLPSPAHPSTASAPSAACAHCVLRELCLTAPSNALDSWRPGALAATRLQLRRGDALFRHGSRFEALYAVRSGFFKTRVSSPDGRDQITGFQMTGELLGLDGIGEGVHASDALALEDSQVCLVPYSKLERLAQQFPGLQTEFHRILSREIVRHHAVMLLLSNVHADRRLAAFLLNLAQRLGTRGYSAASLVLRMTREEIGAYLGLKLETVSRSFSRLHERGMLDVRQRQVCIIDPSGLRELAGDSAA
jgi:CRP/FNR family transcriptional regulator